MSQQSDDEAIKMDDFYVLTSKEQLYQDAIRSLDDTPEKRLKKMKKRMKKRSKTEVKNINDIQVGSEISYGRRGYKHHAVVISVNKDDGLYTIIHLSGNALDSFMASSGGGGKAKPTQESMTLDDTLKQKTFQYTYNVHGKQVSFYPEIIKERAKALMGVYLSIDKLDYDLLQFNCQHFASYCVTGIPFCKPLGKTLCCGERGLEFNVDAKKVLDAKLKQSISKKLKDKTKVENNLIGTIIPVSKKKKDSPVVEASSPLPNIPD